MPTGYTCIIEDNPATTLRDYALRCALAFGHCAHQQDESADAPRVREIDPFYAEVIQKAEALLLKLRSMSEADIRAAFDDHVASVKRHNEEYAAEHASKAAAYARMRSQVEAWQPPTPDHAGLKKFMLEQIDLCYDPKEGPLEVPIPLSAIAWHEAHIERAKRDLDHWTRELQKELERVRKANAWIGALYASLPEAGA